jgi:hypothetical protein
MIFAIDKDTFVMLVTLLPQTRFLAARWDRLN